MENKNNINHKIKAKLDHHEFDFRPQSWDNMEALLDGKQAKKSYFKTKTIIIMMTAILFLMMLLWRHDAPPTEQAPQEQATPQAQAILQDGKTDESVREITEGPSLDFQSFENLESLVQLQAQARERPPLITNHQSLITNFFQKITAKLAAFNQHYAPEKVYLQFDRSYFEPGEAIWFNAYLRDANSLKPSPKSEVLYAELIAPNGSVLKKITLLAKDGTAAGDFQLDKTAAGGMYKIRAYTNWMRNTNDAFERDIQVQASVLPRLRMELDFMRKAYGPGDAVEVKIDLNTLANEPLSKHHFWATASLDGQQFTKVEGHTDGGGRAYLKFDLPKELATNDGLLNVLIEHEGQTESISRSIPIVLHKIDLQFMPEGGDMVAGIQGTVAFKALNEFGKPADVEGIVTDAKGNKISTFRSYHQGMGAFEMVPERGETYLAHLTKPEGISETFALPKALQRGYALHVGKVGKNELTVEINSTENEALHLVLVSSGEIYFTQTLPATAEAHFIKIPTSAMPIGTAQLTLFDSKEIPRAERLVFLNPHKKLKVEITTDKEKYLPREKVQMTVRVTDERGMPMPGQFSLSVADDNLLTFADDKQGHILSHLLLESELEGEVKEPNFYFDKKEKHPKEDQLLALDYLMLTQGWRRFSWEKVLWEQPMAMAYFSEEAKIKGRVLGINGEPLANAKVGLSGTDLTATSDENGYFVFETLVDGTPVFTLDQGAGFNKRRAYSKLENGSYILEAPYKLLHYPDLPIAAAPKKKGQHGQTTLQGILKDADTGENLIFATVALYKKGVLVTGTESDFEGFYSITELDAGTYDVVVSYTGYQELRIKDVIVSSGRQNVLDTKLSSGVTLSEVCVVYEQPLIQTDNTTQGKVLTAEEIKKLPTRNVNALASLSAGVSAADENKITIRGSRSGATNYYIDGVRVSGNSVPAQMKDELIALEEAVTFEDASIEEETSIVVPRTNNAPPPPMPPPPPPANDADGIFKIVEEMPVFMAADCQQFADNAKRKKCSEEKLKSFISQNALYTSLAKDKKLEGTVVVKFTVEKDGSISGAQVVRDIGGGLGLEALQAIQLTDGMWTPGSQKGRPVRVQYNMPVKFSLNARATDAVTPRNNGRFYIPRQFYSPKYKAERSADTPRNDFRKTIFWKPDLTTDRNGTATVEFYNSDAISTFRATVEGLGMDGSIGHGEQRFFTQMPFGMQVKIPANLLAGDQVILPLTLMNNTDRPISGQLKINTPPHFSLQKPLPETIQLSAGETKTIYPKYEVGLAAKSGKLEVSFQAEGMADHFSEAVKIQPRGFPVAQVFGGNKKSQTFDFEVNKAIEGSQQMALTVHPSILSDLTTGLEKMLRQPHGCFEQTSSSNYPNLLVLNYLKSTGNAAPAIEKRAAGFLDRGYKRLLTFEVNSGGFDWYGRPPGHEALSAYGLMEFVDMQAVYPVDQALIDRTAEWLLTRRDGKGSWLSGRKGLHSWKQKSAIADAYITWAMTEAGYGKKVAKEIKKTLADAEETRDPYLMALAANILLNTKDAGANGLLQQLAAAQSEDGSWMGKTHSMTHSRGKNLRVETTGLAALAFLKAPSMQVAEDGHLSGQQVANAAVDFLAGAKTNYGFGSTQATVLALKAMVKHAEIYSQNWSGGAVAVWVNGQKAGEQTVTTKRNEAIVFADLAQYLQEGKNEVKVSFSGSDTALPYDLSVNYSTRQPQSNDDCLLGLETALLLAPKESFRTEGEKIKMGSTVRLTTTLTNKSGDAVANPIAIVGIPAGLGIQPWQVKEMQEKELFDFYEIMDGYVVFYFRKMDGKEVKTIHLDLKAEVPGEYEAPASSAYLYYANDAVVWDKPEKIGIRY
ncbi:MAG TPA: TonB family protein [Bacteroidetes bacterium]|nr:TonB family protein [Bacteroidota bacterium]